ncbi:MAG: YggS family pyridoxal phosphate-dependent enzyme [Mangrovibacterium sp.]
MSIKENIMNVRQHIPKQVCLIAVSKYKPVKDLEEAYAASQRVFGESKVQEVVEKYEWLPKDIEWHFIGHLQTNKVKYIAPFIQLIHGVDSWKLLLQINKEAKKNNRVIDCLVQFHIAQEETKFGLDLTEIRAILDSEVFRELQNVRICGVMGMASYTEDEQQVRNEFANLKEIFISLRKDYFCNEESFKEISMGMSGDYELAIAEGSTMVRVGSAIFGTRNYN